MAVDFKDFKKLKWYYQITIVVFVCGALLGLVWYQFLSPMQVDIDAKKCGAAEASVTDREESGTAEDLRTI